MLLIKKQLVTHIDKVAPDEYSLHCMTAQSHLYVPEGSHAIKQPLEGRCLPLLQCKKKKSTHMWDFLQLRVCLLSLHGHTGHNLVSYHLWTLRWWAKAWL